MVKRGQVTIFFIVGLVLIILVSFVLYVGNITKRAPLEEVDKYSVLHEKGPINFFIKSCLDVTLEDALDKLGEHGGYINRLPGLRVQFTEDYDFTFLLFGRDKFLPEVELMKTDIEEYINENLRYCLDDLAIYEEQGWELDIPTVTSEVNINENNVIASVGFPVRFTRPKVSFQLDKLITTKEVSLPKILREVDSILLELEATQQEIDRAKETLDDNNPFNDEIPDIEIPPPSFTRNGLLFLDYLYPNSGRMLWIVKEKDFKFFFATELEI